MLNQKLSSLSIHIITIHSIHNFGSVFQSYALVKYLTNNGLDAKLIDYQPLYYFSGRSLLSKIVSIALNPLQYKRQYDKYKFFIDHYIPKTNRKFRREHELKEYYKDLVNSVLIAGGDQLWNNYHPCGNDDAYKLTFASGVKKIAFGTSMGRNTFTNEELSKIEPAIKDFSFIGLREQSTVSMLAPFSQVAPCHVVDPVLLLDKEDYLNFIDRTPLVKERYLVMYLAPKSRLLDYAVNYIAEKRGLKIVHICGFTAKCKCDYFLKDTGPKDLLNLIYNAEFVVSASFHATLFSLLFNKQFCSLLPGEKTNTRIEDLLSYYGLEHRIIRKESDCIKLNDSIDFIPVNSEMRKLVEQSRTMLLDIINN